MTENEKQGLQRLDIENKLPTGFEHLSEQERRNVIMKITEQDLELRKDMLQRFGKSRIAEHDITVGIDAVQKLDHERKIYSKRMKGETGSGSYDLQIRGGDTRFIVPIILAIGLVILAILLIIGLT